MRETAKKQMMLSDETEVKGHSWSYLKYEAVEDGFDPANPEVRTYQYKFFVGS